ncbi:MAG: hypothetical protein ACRC8S_20735 [Fimbriiglobus sp.]
MRRYAALCLSFLTVSFATMALGQGPATDTSPEGRWKLTVQQGEEPVAFLFAFSKAEGKWIGDYLSSTAQLRAEPKLENLVVSENRVQFQVMFAGREFVNFEGVLSKDGKKLTGSMTQFGGPLQTTELTRTKLKKLDDGIEVARELLQQEQPSAALLEPALTVLGQASARKIPMEEVRAIIDLTSKSAASHGPRWENSVTLKLARTLSTQDGLSDLALAQIRRAERMVTDETPVLTQLEINETISTILTKAGKADEAKKYLANATKLEAQDYTEYSKKTLSFAPKPYAGRKGKSDRVAVVEVFTGAECPPCAAVDVACDGLLVAYKPTDVIVLNYHFHVPAPDPLTSPEGMQRVGTYGDQVRAAPTVFVNGKAGPKGGGPVAAAKEKYADFTKQLDELLETPTTAKLELTASPAAKGYTLKATVTEIETPGEKVRLRLAVAEDRVRYAGGNGIRYHHMVVRDMPGGANGTAITKKGQEVTATLDLDALREKLVKSLDEYAKAEGPFLRPDRPMALKNLKVVALLQNDATGEILQAKQIDLDAKK